MHLSPILLDEARDALLSARLRKTYSRTEQAVLAWLETLRDAGAVFDGPLPDIGPVCRDPNDHHVIAAAVATEADVIVTGDKDLLAMGQYGAVRIVAARSLQAKIGKEHR